MNNALFFALTLFAALGSGLMAGLFFTFSTFIMTALGRLPPAQGIAAMNGINAAILNPLFALVFFGTPLACAVLLVRGVLHWSAPGSVWLIAGCAVYILGGFVVTVVFNVPLNNALAAVDPAGTDGAALWTRYLSDWTNWNHVRTAACTVAAALLIAGVWIQR